MANFRTKSTRTNNYELNKFINALLELQQDNFLTFKNYGKFYMKEIKLDYLRATVLVNNQELTVAYSFNELERVKRLVLMTEKCDIVKGKNIVKTIELIMIKYAIKDLINKIMEGK
jgi:hypothetical protein